MRCLLAPALLLLCAASAGGRSLPDMRGHELPGWQGERSVPRRVAEEEVSEAVASASSAPIFLSWSPRIILVKRFLSEDEAAHTINLARANMQRSSVVDNNSGGSVVDQIRTSSGTFLAPNQDDTLRSIQMRIAELSMLPQENQEALQVLHYGLKEKYGAHMDTFFDARHIGEQDGGQRIATALMFLNAPEEGGETVFPNVAATNEGPGWSACARDALAHKPQTGDLILFWSLTPAGEIDPGATHTACPVIRGEKWSAPLWIRQGAFQPSSRKATKAPNGQLVASGDACVDLHKECRGWAASGECKKNAGFMVGDRGQCRASCKACPYPTDVV